MKTTPEFTTDPAFDNLCEFLQKSTPQISYRQFCEYLDADEAELLIQSFPERTASEMAHVGAWLNQVQVYIDTTLEIIDPEVMRIKALVEEAYEGCVAANDNENYVLPLSYAMDMVKQSVHQRVAS